LFQKHEKINLYPVKLLARLLTALEYQTMEDNDSSKTTPRRAWRYLLAGGFIIVVTAVYCSIFPPDADWVGMKKSKEESQEATERVNDTVTKITTTQKTEQSKTLWDWMSLLLVPATLAGFGLWFQSSQEQAKAAKEVAEKRAEDAAKQRAEDRQLDDALENYINSVSDLLIGKGLSTLARQKEKDTLKEGQKLQEYYLLKAGLDVIHARTLSILRRLTNEKDPKRTDAGRKGSVLLFLYDTGLIRDQTLLRLNGADLSGAHLSNAYLNGAYLGGANLNDAFLLGTHLDGANLHGARLNGADLSGAHLYDATLLGTHLDGANLNDAFLWGARLCGARLRGTDLHGAHLLAANLNSADLSNADLSNADLSNADLSNADLSNAVLLKVNFWDAQGLLQQQLEGENPPLLCNVTLPNGIGVDPNRDCEELPQALVNRYPESFKDLAEAQAFVDKYSKS
jgi:hypothetical protein